MAERPHYGPDHQIHVPIGYTGEHVLATDLDPMYHSEGQVGFGMPPEYIKRCKELEATGAFIELDGPYPRIDLEPAKNFLREHFGISNNPEIFFSGNGSDGILNRLPLILPQPPADSRIILLGPCFPNLVRYALQYRDARYAKNSMQIAPVTSPLFAPMTDTIEKAMRATSPKRLGKNTLYYVCNPTTPTGERIPQDMLRELATYCEHYGSTLVIDEAFSNFEKNDSSAELTDQLSNVIVLGTFSKNAGLAGLRAGFGIISKDSYGRYKPLLLPYEIAGGVRLKINIATNHDVLPPHMKYVREQTKLIKTALMEAADDAELTYLPTSKDTSLMTFSEDDAGYYDSARNLAIDVAPGQGFASTHSEMDNSKFRVTIPATLEEVEPLVQRLWQAKNALWGSTPRF